MGSRYDVAIVGGGIVGLATAYSIARRAPATRIVVVEKEAELASHQTGRNSGVVHAGIYYAPGTMKARLALAGRRRLERFAQAHDIPYERVGKVVVATRPEEVPRLRGLHDRAVANGVEGLRKIDRDELLQIEPHVEGVAALHSPSTAITDFRQVALALAREVERRGGDVLVEHEVIDLRTGRDGAGELLTRQGVIAARAVVTCAGLHSDRLAASTGGSRDLRIVPFRGRYLRLRPSARALVRGNIYPVPDPRLPFLGVHFTPRIDGEVLLGPNAVLALHREGYGRDDRFRWCDVRETFGYVGFWRLASRHVVSGVRELWRDRVHRSFIREAQRFVPELRDEDVEDGDCGIRAQAVASDGSLVDDFAIESHGPFVHVRNAPSPAATASLAIGDAIAARALRDQLTA
ncbi:MAG: L-2-hydroxyglutarate oxidase [Actinomycetota bacterium]|nr:L-2-hydroxyglutarate oxidase [Actinomycetota bacterium]